MSGWCTTQKRVHLTRGLTDERQQLLQNLKGWKWQQDLDDLWKTMYEDCEKFIKSHKKLPSSTSQERTERALAAWCDHQRMNKRLNKLEDARSELLERLSLWRWTTFADQTWLQQYGNLSQFFKLNNRWPHRRDEEEKILVVWCDRQKSMKRQNKLDQERCALLDQLSLWNWDMKRNLGKMWQQQYDKLERFLRLNNRLPVSSKNGPREEHLLSRWCDKQRTKKEFEFGFGLDAEAALLFKFEFGFVFVFEFEFGFEFEFAFEFEFEFEFVLTDDVSSSSSSVDVRMLLLEKDTDEIASLIAASSISSIFSNACNDETCVWSLSLRSVAGDNFVNNCSFV